MRRERKPVDAAVRFHRCKAARRLRLRCRARPRCLARRRTPNPTTALPTAWTESLPIRTAVKSAGPKFDPNCSSAPASAPPPVASVPRTTPPTPSPQSPSVPKSSPAPYTPRPALTGDPASNNDYLLLTSEEVKAIVGGPSDLKVDGSLAAGPSDNSALVKPPTCVGVIFTAEQSVYGNTGFVAMRDETLGPASDRWSTVVQQTVAVYPTPEQALALMTSSETRWRECASGEVSYRVPGTTQRSDGGSISAVWNFTAMS
jgi:PknH-like extracellular domain